jgi:hypothetical protein
MATLRERKLKGGKTSITAQIVRRNPQYQESKTFDKPKTAQAWTTKREEEIDTEMRPACSRKSGATRAVR